MHIEQIKEMFREMVIKKEPATIPKYYHPDFMLYTNDTAMNYETFLKSHEQYYSTPIEYQIEFDEETLLEQGDKMAGRIWITTSRLREPSTKIEVILIVQFKEDKIYRLWELTYPDWSQLPAFKS